MSIRNAGTSHNLAAGYMKHSVVDAENNPVSSLKTSAMISHVLHQAIQENMEKAK